MVMIIANLAAIAAHNRIENIENNVNINNTLDISNVFFQLTAHVATDYFQQKWSLSPSLFLLVLI